MNCIENAGVHARIITPEDGGHYFFGYYDLQPFDATGRFHLCHRAPFEDRIPEPEDVCQLGLLDLEKGIFQKFGETTAWNFQQGALLQWYGDDDHVIYNVRRGGAFQACVQNIRTGKQRFLPRAYTCLSPDAKKALCINFSRMFDFRPGYGYAGIPDPWKEENAPSDDGIFLMDTQTGETRLLLSLADLKAFHWEEPCSEEKLLINHITFSPDGAHFVMLLRNFKNPELGIKWKTQLLTSDLEGNLSLWAPFSYQSHYHWKNARELVMYGGNFSNDRADGALWQFTLGTVGAVRLPEPNPTKDVHCLYSPNRRYISGDDYPKEDEYRTLHLIDTETNTDHILGRYHSFISDDTNRDRRCDLHARFDRSGRWMSFDSIHTGHRTVCLLDLSLLPQYEY